MGERRCILFNDFLIVWLEEIKSAHAPSTYVKYYQTSRKHIIPYFKNRMLKEITEKELRKFRDSLQSEHSEPGAKKRSETTIRSVVMIVNQVMKTAYRRGFVMEPISVSFTLRRRKTIVQVFSSGEQSRLERYIKSNLNDTTLGIYLCLYTGLRLGELCALRWENVNIREGYLHVRYTAQRLPVDKNETNKKTELLLTPPKSDSSMRLVPIPSFLLPLLNAWGKENCPENFILTGRADDPMEPRTIQYRYKRCLERAGVPYLNFHALRHTFATRCITVGIDPKTLSEILGHSDIKITMDYYFHSSFEFKKNQIERLTAYV